MAKTITGVVSTIAGQKTISVKIERRKTHPILKKQYIDTKKLLVHDEKSEAKVGDQVSIIECRPLSAKKHFKLEKILVRAKLSQDSLAVLKAEEVSKSPSKAKAEKVEEDIPKSAKEGKK